MSRPQEYPQKEAPRGRKIGDDPRQWERFGGTSSVAGIPLTETGGRVIQNQTPTV